MNQTIKQWLIVICLTVFPAIAFADDVQIDGIYYSINDATKTASVTRGNYSGNIVIPETIDYDGIHYMITTICEKAFYNCFGLTSVTIPNSVTSIGKGAFYNCSGLNSLTIPNSVTSIGYRAFSGCYGLTSVTIPNSITTIGDYVFSHCSGLTSVTIPNSVTSIGDYAFYSCKGLKSVTIPNSVTSIGYCAFYGCYGLTSVTIPNSVTSIGDNAFSGCYGLTSVTIPNSVTSIGSRAFSGCSGLTTVTIEGSEVLLAAESFEECTNIKTVNALSTLPPIGADNTFELITYRDAMLNVPKTAKDAYSKPACWRNFRHVEEKDFGGVDDVTADGSGICVNVRDGQVEVSGADASEEIRVYDLSGMEIYRGTDRTIALPTKGVYIVKVAGRTFKVLS